MATGILLVALDYSNAREDEFHDWLDQEHLPERRRVPGIVTAERWLGSANPRHSVASYELASVDVLRSEPYRAITGDNLTPWSKRMGGFFQVLLRFQGEQITPGDLAAPAGRGGLLVNAMNVEAEQETEFNAWYDTEHIPGLASVPGVVQARRFRDDTGTHRYLALYPLESPEVTCTGAWKKAARTPWTFRMRPFIHDHLRFLTKRHGRGV